MSNLRLKCFKSVCGIRFLDPKAYLFLKYAENKLHIQRSRQCRDKELSHISHVHKQQEELTLLLLLPSLFAEGG